MNTEELRNFFEDRDFKVYLFEQDKMNCAEISKHTTGGVEMLITLMPFTKEKFIEYVDGFNVDDEIDLHRQDMAYKQAFTIRRSVEDFTEFHNELKKIVSHYKML